jgi:hypothetical protein
MTTSPSNDFDVADAVTLLSRTPAVLTALLSDLPERWLQATEADGAWSPFDVLGHLIHGERVNWMARVRHILAGDTNPFPPFDRAAMFRDSVGKSCPELLVTFDQLRRGNVAALQDLRLSAQDLDRAGNHPEFGEVTLRQLLSTWAVHDLDHVAQIVRTLAKAHRHDVGPWSAFLSLLHDRE